MAAANSVETVRWRWPRTRWRRVSKTLSGTPPPPHQQPGAGHGLYQVKWIWKERWPRRPTPNPILSVCLSSSVRDGCTSWNSSLAHKRKWRSEWGGGVGSFLFPASNIGWETSWRQYQSFTTVWWIYEEVHWKRNVLGVVNVIDSSSARHVPCSHWIWVQVGEYLCLYTQWQRGRHVPSFTAHSCQKRVVPSKFFVDF